MGDREAQKYGRSGQAQHGVDVYGRRDGRWQAVQCKRKQRFPESKLTEAKVRHEVTEAYGFSRPLETLMIATTAQPDTAIQDLAAELTDDHAAEDDEKRRFRVVVYGWDELGEKLRQHPGVYGLWRRELLGSATDKGIISGVLPVSNLPPHFLPRPEDLAPLKAALLEGGTEKLGVTGSTRQLVGVQGMGGIGKTVLAAAACHEPDVQTAFADGILWITIGQEPNLLRLQQDLARALGAGETFLGSVAEGKRVLKSALAERCVLLVLDDVWKLEHAAALCSPRWPTARCGCGTRTPARRCKPLFTMGYMSKAWQRWRTAGWSLPRKTARCGCGTRTRAKRCLLSKATPTLSGAVAGRVVSASSDGTLRIWDPQTGQTLKTLESFKYVLARDVAALADGRVILGAGKTVRVWDPQTGRMLKTLEGHTNRVTDVAALADGRVVSASWDTLRMWDPDTGQTLKTLEGHTDCVTCVAALADGRVVSASDDGALRVWDPDGALRVWDPDTGQTLQTFEGHTDGVLRVAALADGRWFSVSSDGTLRVWDPQTAQTLKTLEGHTDSVWGVAALADDRVVSASKDRTLRVWDPQTGEVLATFHADVELSCVAARLRSGSLVAGDSVGRLLWLHFEEAVL